MNKERFIKAANKRIGNISTDAKKKKKSPKKTRKKNPAKNKKRE